MATQGLASNKILSLEGGEEVADGGETEENSGRNEGTSPTQVAQKLDNGHNKVGRCSKIVGGNFANKVVKLARGWANSQEQRHLNEQDETGRHSKATSVSGGTWRMLHER